MGHAQVSQIAARPVKHRRQLAKTAGPAQPRAAPR